METICIIFVFAAQYVLHYYGIKINKFVLSFRYCVRLLFCYLNCICCDDPDCRRFTLNYVLKAILRCSCSGCILFVFKSCIAQIVSTFHRTSKPCQTCQIGNITSSFIESFRKQKSAGKQSGLFIFLLTASNVNYTPLFFYSNFT